MPRTPTATTKTTTTHGAAVARESLVTDRAAGATVSSFGTARLSSLITGNFDEHRQVSSGAAVEHQRLPVEPSSSTVPSYDGGWLPVVDFGDNPAGGPATGPHNGAAPLGGAPAVCSPRTNHCPEELPRLLGFDGAGAGTAVGASEGGKKAAAVPGHIGRRGRHKLCALPGNFAGGSGSSNVPGLASRQRCGSWATRFPTLPPLRGILKKGLNSHAIAGAQQRRASQIGCLGTARTAGRTRNSLSDGPKWGARTKRKRVVTFCLETVVGRSNQIIGSSDSLPRRRIGKHNRSSFGVESLARPRSSSGRHRRRETPAVPAGAECVEYSSRGHRRPFRTRIEMASKAPPGPLSLTLYIFLGLLVATCLTCFVNVEWRSVQSRRELMALRNNYVPVPCESSDEHNYKIVHIDCPLRNIQVFRPPAEFAWNVGPFQGVFLEMKVEMYQWVLHSRMFAFYFSGEWSTNLVDSSRYPFIFYNSHVNPEFFPTIEGSGRRFARQIFTGDYRLARKHLLNFHGKTQLPLFNDGYYTPPVERPPTSVSYANTQVYNNALYTGNPTSPKVGDLRVSFWGSIATHVSVIAQQHMSADGVVELLEYSPRPVNIAPDPADEEGDPTVPVELPYFTNSSLRELVYEGDYLASEMFAKRLADKEGSAGLRWTVRIFTCVVVATFIGFSYRIADTAVNVAAAPLMAGAVCVSAACLFALLAVLYITLSVLTSVAYGVAATVSIVCGISCWLLGKQTVLGSMPATTSPHQLDRALANPDENNSDIEIALLPRRTQTSPPTPIDTSRHFYQPL